MSPAAARDLKPGARVSVRGRIGTMRRHVPTTPDGQMMVVTWEDGKEEWVPVNRVEVA